MDEDDDDLDELLDEVEEKFCRNVSVKPTARVTGNEAGKHEKKDAGGQRQGATTKPAQPLSSISKDIDALLEELLEDDRPDSTQQKTEQSKAAGEERKPSSQTGGRKCEHLVLSCFCWRELFAKWRRNSHVKEVLMFDDCEWDSSCDYLFFRNNMPERQKLQAKLKKRRGFRSYSCQCSWFSTSELTELRERALLRWVCGKHKGL